LVLKVGLETPAARCRFDAVMLTYYFAALLLVPKLQRRQRFFGALVLPPDFLE
jgi:hypothetical protein